LIIGGLRTGPVAPATIGVSDVRTVVTGRYTEAAAERLRARDGVEYVERDDEMEALEGKRG